MEYINNFSEVHLIEQNKFPSAGDGNNCQDYVSDDIVEAINTHQELVFALVQDTFVKSHSAK